VRSTIGARLAAATDPIKKGSAIAHLTLEFLPTLQGVFAAEKARFATWCALFTTGNVSMRPHLRVRSAGLYGLALQSNRSFSHVCDDCPLEPQHFTVGHGLAYRCVGCFRDLRSLEFDAADRLRLPYPLIHMGFLKRYKNWSV
jgi:hypothetical protein